MTLASEGFLRIGDSDLEYRLLGPSPDQAPTLVLLHEGLGSAALWGDFPEKLQAATGLGVFVYSRAGYGPRRRSSCRVRSITCSARRSMCCQSCSIRSAFSAA